PDFVLNVLPQHVAGNDLHLYVISYGSLCQFLIFAVYKISVQNFAFGVWFFRGSGSRGRREFWRIFPGFGFITGIGHIHIGLAGTQNSSGRTGRYIIFMMGAFILVT